MKLQDIKPEGSPLVRATAAEVGSVESELGLEFPKGYLEYVTEYGEGTLATYVRVYPPWRVLKEWKVFQKRIRKYWLWDDGSEALPKKRALQLIIFCDTLNGDEVVFHPTAPNQIFVLPRGGGIIHEIGRDLFEALDWLCGSGILTKAVKNRSFKPFDSRAKLKPSPKAIDVREVRKAGGWEAYQRQMKAQKKR